MSMILYKGFFGFFCIHRSSLLSFLSHMLHLGAMVHSLESYYEHHTVHPRVCGVSDRPEQADEQTVQSLQTLFSCLSTTELRAFDAPERHDEGKLVECDLECDKALTVLNSAVSELATLDREFTELLFEMCEALVDIHCLMPAILGSSTCINMTQTSLP